MPFHDPRGQILKLREQLASHDKPIAFLVGAGASSAVKDIAGEYLIPALRRLTELSTDAVKALGEPYETGFEAVRQEADRNLGRPPNIEDLLSSVRLKARAMGPGDTLSGLSVDQMNAVEEAIRRQISVAARPDEGGIPKQLPHHALARWIGRTTRSTPVEIFTTNYDTLIERALEDERIPVFDGFVGSRQPFFMPSSLTLQDEGPGRGWARLWKLHGSVNWAWQTKADGTRRIVRGPENDRGELILPSLYKYDESRRQPYVAMLDRLSRFLGKRDDALLIAIGYSFGDQDINAVIFDALEARERMHVVALLHSDPKPDGDIAKRAISRRNLLVYGPSTAIIGGVTGTWQLFDPVDTRSVGLLDIPFDSDAQTDPAVPAVTGRLRLGDFKWFGRFIDAISGGDDG